MTTRALLAIGANLTSSVGPPAMTIQAAVAALRERCANLSKVSSLYKTPAFPVGSGPDFVNAAAVLDTPAAPRAVLALLHEVEAVLGRTRDVRWGARVIDLDLIGMEDHVLPNRSVYDAWAGLPASAHTEKVPDTLILPHPRMQERSFVLVPLAEVAPNWRHPVLGKTVLELRDALPQAELGSVQPLE
ncbi:MAG: 2-amino-4-hydroxy-6-hydroxymethyldihydropteridine diphosphokinase [Pseudomonadota bacterium]